MVSVRVPKRSPRTPIGSDTTSVAKPAEARTVPSSIFVSDSRSANVGARGTIAIQTTSVRKINA
jgi:hypothetical protein